MVFWFGRRKENEKTARGLPRDVEAARGPGELSGAQSRPHRVEDIVGAPRRSRRIGVKAEYRGDDGVYVRPTPITAGSEVTVKYDGLLARSGADQVYLHMGFGPGDAWRDIRDLPMTKTNDDMWTTVVPIDIEETSRLNFCFRDSANNWDNNSGANWSYEIHNGENPMM